MTMANINRGTSNIVLPHEVSSEIWAKTLESSAVMQLARRVALPGAGMEFQTITGEPSASWVNETAAKGIGVHTFGKKTMKGYTLAVIEPFSNQFRRDKAALYDELVRRLPYALSKKFDETVFGISAAPGENFDTMANVTAASIVGTNGAWAGLVAADAAIAGSDYILNGWALSPKAKSILLTETDGNERPLFISSLTREGGVNELMGQPAYIMKGVYKAGTPAGSGTAGVPEQLGFAGDWNQAVYGVVEDVNISISDQATLVSGDDVINLFQSNMFAVRCEFEVGFLLKDSAAFVKLTGAIPTE